MKKAFFLVFALLGTAIALAPQTSAASGFNAGRIIDDSVFTNKSSMSVSDIQSFLNSKVAACDTSGSQQSEMNNSGVPDYNGNGSIQRWEWGKYKFNQTTFPCLKDYTQDNVSAAQLIYNASQNYSINPQVLIVLLQKEQGLVTDTWPLNIQYRSATGYGCPDTAACDSQYYGLANQITWASKMFRAILNNSPDWYTPYVLGNNYIQYSPDSNCGGSTVNIQNRSTQALYNYTPYQPNQAALDAGWGTATCGAYGNRNFYLYFTNWFGSTQGSFDSMSNPRWMQLKSAVRKIDPSTSQPTGDLLPSGQQIKFTTKIEVASGSCLRTQHDTENNIKLCIPISSIDELNISYSSTTASDKLMMLTQPSYKQDLRTNKQITSFPLQKNQQISFDAKTTIGGVVYYITKNDYTNSIEYGIPANSLEASTTYEAISPHWFRLSIGTQKINPLQNRKIESVIDKNTAIQFSSRAQINGAWYYRTAYDSNNGLDKAISEDSLIEIFDNFQNPRWMITTQDVQKINVTNKEVLGGLVKKGTPIFFPTKTELPNGDVYFRTKYDTDNNTYFAIPSTALVDINYENFKQPRWLVANEETQQVSPYTGASISTIAKGSQLKFMSKIEVNGTIFYRDQANTNAQSDIVINSTNLSEIQYTPFIYPRQLKLTNDTYKQVPAYDIATGGIMHKDMTRRYTSKIEVNGKVYYRTENDTNYNLNLAIDSALLIEP